MRLIYFSVVMAMLPLVCRAGGSVEFERIDQLLQQKPELNALLHGSLVMPGGAYAEVRLGPQFEHLSAYRLGRYSFQAKLRSGSAQHAVLVTVCTKYQFLDSSGRAVPAETDRELQAAQVKEKLVAVVLQDISDSKSGSACPSDGPGSDESDAGSPKISAEGLGHVQTPLVANGILQGAPYRIDIPEHWNGALVIFMHGYEPKGVPRNEPWPQNVDTPIFLQRGYAVAASAYSTQGWAVAEAIADSERLRQLFVSTYGQPRHTFAVGISLGGLVALATVEQGGKQYDGALSLCGVNVSASELFADGVVTPLLALEYFFPRAIPLAKEGLIDPDSPPMLDPEAIEAQFRSDEAKASILVRRLEIPRPMLAGAMMLDYMALREMQERAGGHPVDNTKTVYVGFGDDVAFNRRVRRYAGSPAAMAYVKHDVALTGRIDVPVVLQSVAIDQTVPPRFAARYPVLVRNAGRTSNLQVLPAVGKGHCDLSDEQIGKAFDVLINEQ